MSRAFAATVPAVAATMFATSALAGGAPVSMDVTLCQQAVKTQVELEHDKAKIEFGDKDIQTTNSAASQVQVSGHGRFTRKDGTTKHFKYSCTVDTAAGRVVNASWQKTD